MARLAGIACRDCKRGEMTELTAAGISTETGVQGDFRGRPGARQVTVISAEAWAAACAEVDRALPWTTRRANLLVEGIGLPRAAGARIGIGPVRLEITMETDPCSRMDEQCEGLREALMPDWRGGVCCRVISGGTVEVGDLVTVLDGVCD